MRLGCRFEQQAVDHRLVLLGDGGDPSRQRKDDMEILDRHQVGSAFGEPVARGIRLALRAVSITARVVGDACEAARSSVAAFDVTAERCRSASGDSAHHAASGSVDCVG